MSRKKPLRRFATGVPPLDRLLGGGLPAYSVVVVAGEPGTGKTILTQQILFATARAGGKGLYLTTVSESPMKAARYQSAFTFFDPERFGDSVVFLDLGETIRRHRLGAAVELVADSLRQHQPDLVVIDSFKAIHDLSASAEETRTFVYDLAVELSAVQATALLVGEYTADEIGKAPEFAVADGIVWLTLEKTDVGSWRYLQIPKMRGVDQPLGRFAFDIGPDGLAIHALDFAEDAERAASDRSDRVPTGVSGLDELLRGGIPRGAPVLVSGEAGTGKTTLGVQFVHHGAAVRGESCLYFSYEEEPPDVAANAASFGWDLGGLVGRGLLRFHWAPLSRVNVDAELSRIAALLHEHRPARVVVDSLTMLGHAVIKPEVLRRHVFDLTRALRSSGATSLIVTDPPAGSGLISRYGVEESLADGVLVLRATKVGRERKRYVEVHKMRGVAHATGEHLVRIAAKGLEVFPRSEEVLR